MNQTLSGKPGAVQTSDEPGQCFGIVGTDDPQLMTARNVDLNRAVPGCGIGRKRRGWVFSPRPVNKLLGTLGEGEYGLFVCLGSFSRQATELERNRAKLRLVDGEGFVEMVLDNYPNLSPRYRSIIPLKNIYVPDIGKP